MCTLEEQRDSFLRNGGRFVAFPLAGVIIWLTVGLTSIVVSPLNAVYVLLFASGAIFPLALLIAKFTKQKVFQPENLFASLMALGVLMVNLLWALHLILVIRLPAIVPLSIAIALGLHWIVFGWIIQSSLGLIHSISRSLLCLAAFLLFPNTAFARFRSP